MAITAPDHAYLFRGDATDSIGSQDMTISGATLARGKMGYGYSFDDVNDSMTIASNDPFGLSTGFSISFWMKTTATSEQHIMGDNPFSLSFNGFCFRLDGANGELDFLIAYNGQKEGFSTGVATSINDGNWKHIVARWDGANTCQVIVNDGTPASISLSAGSTSSSNNFYVGRNSNSAGNYFGGTLSDIVIWSGYYLTDAEITELYESGNGRMYSSERTDFVDNTDPLWGIVLAHTFDTNGNDSLGVTNFSANGATIGTGIINDGALFSGTNQRFDASYNSFFGANDTWAVSLLFNLDTLTPPDTNQVLWSNSDGSNNRSAIFVRSDGIVRFCTFDGSFTYADVGSAISASSNVHVLAVNNAGSLSLYVNGTLGATTASIQANDGSGGHYIGAFNDGGSIRGEVDGIVDAVHHYFHVPTSDQRTALNGFATGNQYPFPSGYGNTVMGVSGSNIASYMGVAVGDINLIDGV